MPSLHRRSFLGSTLASAAALSFGPHLLGQERPPERRGEETPRGNLPTGPLDSLFLTWQRDPTTTMTIQWVGPGSAADPGIHFAALDGADWQPAKTIAKPYEGTDLQVYRCELTGLAPGAEYKFQVGRGTPEFRFRTMPATLTDELTFVSGGDAGVGEHAVATNRIAAAQDPRFALIVGDLAYDNGRSPETYLQFMRNYTKTMIDGDGRLIPLLAGIGNHEVDGSYGQDRKKATSYLSVFDGFYPEKTFGVLDIGDYLSLVLLDTGHCASIGGEQTDWLARTLADRQDRQHLIAAGHVPCYPSYRAPEGSAGRFGTGQEQRQFWCPLFEKFQVDLVLEHHDHTFKRTHPLTDGRYDKNGVLYLGDGSWGKLRVPKTPEERPYLAKVSQSYHVTVHKLAGNDRSHVALTDTGRVADVTTTRSKRVSRRG